MLICNPSKSQKVKTPTIVTLGNFDGVHIGHQTLMKNLVSIAKEKNLVPTVVTFEPTPKEFFLGNQAPARLITLRQKYNLLQELGIEQVICIRFNDYFAGMSADYFLNKTLIAELNTQHIIVGDDFRFGKNRIGDYSLLQQFSSRHQLTVQDSATICCGKVRASSTLTREALERGDMDHAALILGRPYSMSGKVFYGNQLGRQWGFPTANIILRYRNLPITGVFAVTGKTESGNGWRGVANVGTRPTINGKRNQLEVHFFDCDENLYGQRLEVFFHRKLRDEKKFDSIDDLRRQIEADAQQARSYAY